MRACRNGTMAKWKVDSIVARSPGRAGRTRELHLIPLVIHGAPAVHGADALDARHPALHRRATPRGPSNARGNSFSTGRNGTRAAETKF